MRKEFVFVSLTLIFSFFKIGIAMAEKILIVGVEGVSLNLLNEWLDEGELPHIAKILEEGSIINLTTPLPLVSPVTWTSFATGKNPGEHGIFGWEQCNPYTYRKYIPLADDIKEKTFWQILSENGKRVIVINAYLTYPPKPINGIIISGMPTPSLATYPPELKKKLEKMGYKVEAKGYVDTPKEEFLRDLERTMKKRGEVALELLKSEEWDLFFVLFPEIDRLQHSLWGELERKKGKETILKFYRLLDGIIGNLTEEVGNASVLIISDHGFRKVKKRFHINQWLLRKGYLKLKFTPRNLVNSFLLRACTLLKQTGLSDIFLKIFKKGGKTKPLEFEIDWENTKAFSCAFYDPGIYINPLFEKEKIKEQLRKELLRIKDPLTHKNVIKKVYTKEEIYSGKYLDYAPDILILPNENYEVVGAFTFAGLFESKLKERGTHAFGGFLILNRKSEPKNIPIEEVEHFILNFFGLKD